MDILPWPTTYTDGTALFSRSWYAAMFWYTENFSIPYLRCDKNCCAVMLRYDVLMRAGTDLEPKFGEGHRPKFLVDLRGEYI